MRTFPGRMMALALTVAGSAPALEIITVDHTQLYQEMDGFGASFDPRSAGIVNRMKPARREQVLRDLFDPVSGAGLSCLRQTIALEGWTYDDLPEGETDFEMKRFSIDRDREHVIPVLKSALRISPGIWIMVSAWSAPAWMKTGRHLFKGRLIDSNEVYSAYAEYYVRLVRAYAAEGLKIGAMTLQNETSFEPGWYAGMLMYPEDQSRLAIALGKRFREEGITTRILVWDHNWEPEWPLAILANPESRQYIDGVAWHSYGGNPDVQVQVKDAFPEKNAYFTEAAAGSWSASFGGDLMWDATNLVVGSTRRWAKSVTKFMMVTPTTDKGNRGVLTVDEKTGKMVKNEDYYVLAHAAKFVRPGARRAYSSAPTSVTFLNTDGVIALIDYNAGSVENIHEVRWHGRVFRFPVPPQSLVTFTWSVSGAVPVTAWVTTGDRRRLLERQAAFRFGELDVPKAEPAIDLAGAWLFRKGDDMKWKETGCDDAGWERVVVPAGWEEHSKYTDDNVYGWFRRTIEVPASWKGRPLILPLGRIDDADVAYFNGVEIGRTGGMPPNFTSAWDVTRRYRVSPELVRYGQKNVIAIRVFDGAQGGGLKSGLGVMEFDYWPPVNRQGRIE